MAKNTVIIDLCLEDTIRFISNYHFSIDYLGVLEEIKRIDDNVVYLHFYLSRGWWKFNYTLTKLDQYKTHIELEIPNRLNDLKVINKILNVFTPEYVLEYQETINNVLEKIELNDYEYMTFRTEVKKFILSKFNYIFELEESNNEILSMISENIDEYLNNIQFKEKYSIEDFINIASYFITLTCKSYLMGVFENSEELYFTYLTEILFNEMNYKKNLKSKNIDFLGIVNFIKFDFMKMIHISKSSLYNKTTLKVYSNIFFGILSVTPLFPLSATKFTSMIINKRKIKKLSLRINSDSALRIIKYSNTLTEEWLKLSQFK